MELLLNLAWLLLALPAYWLWRERRAGRKFSSLQCLLALGCLLVILFPVVSATDDLRSMRAEMEESPSSKKAFRQASSEKISAARWQSPPALVASTIPFVAFDESWLQASTPRLFPSAAPAVEHAGRAPPVSFLA
jgi:hypothetical protein